MMTGSREKGGNNRSRLACSDHSDSKVNVNSVFDAN